MLGGNFARPNRWERYMEECRVRRKRGGNEGIIGARGFAKDADARASRTN